MIISDRGIRRRLTEERLRLSPISDDQIQPASVDLRLSDIFLLPVENWHRTVVPGDPDTHPTWTETKLPDGLVLPPSGFALGCTIEEVELPADLVGRVEGKSSLGRLGLLVHVTAGFIDPGFRGQITLELFNVAGYPIRLHPGMRICQIGFQALDVGAERKYGHPELRSHYQNQHGPTATIV